MKNFTILLLSFSLIVLSSISCSTTKTVITEQHQLAISGQKTYHIGQKVTITVKNISDKNIEVLNPVLKTFQYFNGSNWQDVKIFICPCDAPCQQPPKFITLKPGDVINYTWTQKENKCGEKNQNGIRKTLSIQVPKGKYRALILYKSDNQTKSMYFYFKIK